MNKLEQAMENHKKGKWQEADTVYEELLQEEPENAEVMYLLAISKNSQNQLDEAENIIEKAIELNGNAPAFLQTKGMILARKGKTDEAIEILSKALTKNPNLYQSHITIGHLYYAKGMKKEAAKHFNMAIKVDKEQVEGHVNLAKILIDQGEPQEAINILNALEQEHPEQVSIKMMMGQGFIERGAYSFAENYFQKVLAMHPEYDLAGLYLGIAKLNTGDMENAEKLITAFNQQYPNTREGLAGLGQLMFKRNNFRVSANYLHNAIGEGISPLTWRVTLVESLARLGQFDPAISLYEENSEKIEYTNGEFRLAELYELKGETGKAKEQYKKINKDDSKYIASLLGLTRCYLVENKPEKAEKTSDKILLTNQDHAEAILLKLTSLLFQKKEIEALEILKEIKYDKFNDVYKKTFRLQHGLIHDYMKNYQEAINVFLDKSKTEEQKTVKVKLLKEEDIKAIQSFGIKTEESDKNPVFIIGSQSTAINEFASWLSQEGIVVLNDRLVSKGRPDILYAEQTIEVLTAADDEMVKLERQLYKQKAKVMMGPETEIFADCMYINPQQVAIIRKFFPQSKIILLKRALKDIEFNQTVFGQEPVSADEWQKAGKQISDMGLDVTEVDVDSWLSNDKATMESIGSIFKKELSNKESQPIKYWRKSLFDKGHWQNYEEFLGQ